MSAVKTFKILFRKYPFFRAISVVSVIFLILGFFSIVTYKSRKIPSIKSVNPSVGSPGDLMVITGENFGNTRSSSDYVQVGISKITASGYLSWTDKQIKIVLPTNVQDGLVIVTTKSGSSKPGFFANEAGIPVQVPPDTKTSLPVIISTNAPVVTPGSLLVINGTNFGTIRNNGSVKFTAAIEEMTAEEPVYIAANEANYDFEYWSDSEIHVRVPDGAATGHFFVATEKGESNLFELEIKSPAGTKVYSNKKTYVVNVTADIKDIHSKLNTTLSLRVPRPPLSARQPVAELSECSPEPVFEYYQNTIIHQLELSKIQEKQVRFNHSFVIEDYTVQTRINPRQVKPYKEKERVLYKTYTQSDALIAADDTEFQELAKQIVKKETNPYNQAKLVYDFMIDTYELLPETRSSDSDCKDLIKTNKGDAYDFTIVYTTLLRTLGIPCVSVSGILVDSELNNRNHWWCEFYIENFGWVPVDLVLGKGLEYKAFRPIENTREYYFGSLDSQHIAFSRGYNELKPSLANSHIVHKKRTYALQSIWEESSRGTVNYSSLWNNPVVAGIY